VSKFIVGRAYLVHFAKPSRCLMPGVRPEVHLYSEEGVFLDGGILSIPMERINADVD
jgi:hypothetical protein